ncbi:hypothetical protein LPJ59_003832 [Coemansia sp. RSA 2399]|nr:hypothetical protein LPJ59_003832 [Coemansia sp. RSA 2399]
MMSMSFRQLLQELSHKPVQKKLATTFQETEEKDWGQLKQALEQAEANETSRISDAKKGRNYNLNRYSDIVPFNDNRVRLSGKSDYINATHIVLPESISATRYIATQGPLNHTIGDFWAMVWENQVHDIVMLANPVEARRPKCAVYWPPTPGQTIVPKPSAAGHSAPITVTLRDERPLDDASSGIVVRSLLLRHDAHPSESRIVRHIHYTEWPDHGVPLSPVPLLRMLKALDSSASKGPVVVHCSAGVGRTGTLITLDAAMRFFATHDDYAGDIVADVFRCLRAQRTLMVQNQQQFIFCYQAELEQWNQAVEFFDQREYDSALESIADSAKIHFNIGLILGRKGDHNAGIEAYTSALELDQYLVVAYFQRGVAKMVLQRNDQALDDFNKALQYLRDNEFIDYTQIGLDYKVYTCEVLYNRALCFFCLGQEEDARADLKDASKHTAEERHSWIKKAVQCNGMDCPLYCVPKGIIYRPSASKLKSTKKIDFLGSAKVIASADGKDNFTGFKGALVRKETLKNMATMTHQKSMRVKRSSPPPELSNSSQLARSNTMPIHRNDAPPAMHYAQTASQTSGISQGLATNGGGYSLHNGMNSSRVPGPVARSGTLVKMQSTGNLSTVKETEYTSSSARDTYSDGDGSEASSPAGRSATIQSDTTSPDVLSPDPKPTTDNSQSPESGPRGPVDPLDIIRAGLARRATLKNQQQQQQQQGGGPRPGIPQRSLTMKAPTHEIDYSGINGGGGSNSLPGHGAVRRMNTMGSAAPGGSYMERQVNGNSHSMDNIYEEQSSNPAEARVARTEIIIPAVQQNISTAYDNTSPDYYGSSDDIQPMTHMQQQQQQQQQAGRSKSLPQHPGIAHAQSSISTVMMSPPLSQEEIAAARGIAGIGLHGMGGAYGSASSMSPPSAMSPAGSTPGHYSPLNGSSSAIPPMSAGSGILRRAPTKKDAMKVKVHYGQEIVNLMVPKGASFDLLQAKVEAKVLASTNAGHDEGERKPGTLRIRYLDEDGEAVLMTDEDDYELAKAYAGGDMSSPETNVVERLELWSSF